MQPGIWREIKRGERMVLYYTVCVCVLIVQADFLKSIFSPNSFSLVVRACFRHVCVGLQKWKECVCRHKQGRINCTEEEKRPECVVGGKLGQGQLMYRLSICTYFIPRLENKSCLCLGPSFFLEQDIIVASVKLKNMDPYISFCVLCGGNRFNSTDKIKP